MPDIDEITLLVRAEANAALTNSAAVDLSRAMTDGARRRARRTLVSVIGAAGAVLLMIGGAVALAGPPRQASVVPPAASADPTVTQPPAKVDRFDPTHILLSRHMLPPGQGECVMTTSPTVQSMWCGYPRIGKPTAGLIAIELFPVMPVADGLEVDPSARHMGMADGSAPKGTPGPQLNGAPSVWLENADGSTIALAFSWSSGAWAVASGTTGTVTGANSELLRQTLQQVASGLKTNKATPITLPFSVASPGRGLKVGRMLISTTNDGGYEGQLLFTNAEGEWSRDGLPLGVSVSVAKDNTTGSLKGGYANTTLDGHPAQVDFTGESGRVDLFQVDGHRITVLVYDIAAMGISQQEAIDLARSVHIVPNPADETTWTTTPVR